MFLLVRKVDANTAVILYVMPSPMATSWFTGVKIIFIRRLFLLTVFLKDIVCLVFIESLFCLVFRFMTYHNLSNFILVENPC